jgi:hypothetical protein
MISKLIFPRKSPPITTVITLTKGTVVAQLRHGIEFWGQSLKLRDCNSLQSSYSRPLRRALDLSFNANVNGFLTETGFPSFKRLMQTQSIKTAEKYSRMPTTHPLKIELSRLQSEDDSKPANSLFRKAEKYRKELKALHVDLKLPRIAERATEADWRGSTSNSDLKHGPPSKGKTALYLKIDDPATAAARANLRSGHKLGHWRFSVGIADSEYCPTCTVLPDTREHILLECADHRTARNKAKTAFQRTNIPFTLSLILGAAAAPRSQQIAALHMSKDLVLDIAAKRSL